MERVNAELSEMLDRYDGDALASQSQLEADKRELAAHGRLLQVRMAGPGEGLQ